jgi:hypothetical protein
MQDYADQALRLTVRLEQLSRGASYDMQKVLRKMQKEILGAMLADKITTRNILTRVQKEVRQISLARYEEIEEIVFNHESTTAAAAHSSEVRGYASLGLPASSFAEARATSLVIDSAYASVMPGLGGGHQTTVGDMISRFVGNGVNDSKNIALRAYREGLPVAAITEMVRNSTGLQMRQAETIARTSIQAVANQARQDVADSVGSEKEIWLATLDTKTCNYCQGLDGKCKDKGKFPLLAHPNCRCARLYLPPDMSCSEAKSSLGRVARGPSGRSQTLGKYETFGEWILTQPKKFQEEVLGKKRAKLLRDGKITFDKMYTQAGKRRTVQSIEEHYK